MCAIVLAARPLAVQEGLIQVLVECWVKSKDPDKVRSAAISLRDLTSTLDQNYMAGWIIPKLSIAALLSEK